MNALHPAFQNLSTCVDARDCRKESLSSPQSPFIRQAKCFALESDTPTDIAVMCVSPGWRFLRQENAEHGAIFERKCAPGRLATTFGCGFSPTTTHGGLWPHSAVRPPFPRQL